jgi:hypothetical protein
MLATVDRQPLAAPHPDPGHAVDRTAARLWYTLSVIPQSQARVCQRARDVQRLDPDLAVNRSFSLTTKMRIQVEREVERASRASVKISKRNVLRAAFRKMHGFELW